MEFNAHTIVLTIVVVVVLYLVYTYFFSSAGDILVKLQDARSQSTISPSSLSAGASSDYTFSVWFYVNDWNYRIGQEKIIFERRATSDNKPAPSVSLGANTNNLNVAIETYSQSGNTETSNCVITDVPLQRWTNLIMSVNGRALDLYIDGKLVRTCVLAGPPKTYSNTPIQLCPGGGFSGYVSNFEYVANAISPSQAYDIYKQGYGGGSALSGLFNKYRLKMVFVEGNREVNSFEL
jgi:hypothetical protein